MENRNNLWRQRSGVWKSFIDGDFEEEDVWAVLKDRTEHSSSNSNSNFKVSKTTKGLSSVSAPKHVPTSTRKSTRSSGGSCCSSKSSSAGYNSISEPKFVQQSAPIDIPHWSKIHKHRSKNSNNNDDYEDDDSDSDGKVDVNDDDDKLPPHEFIAKRLERNQISSFSVFEGVGRTLKGRDLSKMRNAVLTKTGFLESL